VLFVIGVSDYHDFPYIKKILEALFSFDLDYVKIDHHHQNVTDRFYEAVFFKKGQMGNYETPDDVIDVIYDLKNLYSLRMQKFVDKVI